MQFEGLIQQIKNCQQCQPELTPNPVFQASENARILIAGQAPGRQAHEQSKPFADASGKRLKSWLGLSEAEFYDPQKVAILPMAFCYPGRGKSGDLPPPKVCAQLWRQSLVAGLRQVRLTIILGRYASAYHLPEDTRTLTELVYANRFLETDKVCLPHPSPRNQAWFKHNPWFEQQLIPRLRGEVKRILLTD